MPLSVPSRRTAVRGLPAPRGWGRMGPGWHTWEKEQREGSGTRALPSCEASGKCMGGELGFDFSEVATVPRGAGFVGQGEIFSSFQHRWAAGK